MMPKSRNLGILFPLAGLNRRGAYRQQAPYSTPECLNVRPVATISGRERGGSRPGLIQSHLDDLGSSVLMLEPMTLALGDGFAIFSDTFSGTELDSSWTQASWADAVPSILISALASIDTTVDEGSIVRDALPIDSTEVYTVEIFVSPYDGAHHGKYRIFLRMDDTTPDIEDEGVQVELILEGSTGTYSGTLKSLTGGVTTSYDLASDTLGAARPGWLTVTVSGDTVTVYWNGVTLKTQVVPTSHAGLRVGFGMLATVAGGVCLTNVFRCQYYSTGAYNTLRTKLIAVADGDLYQESTYGRLTVVTSNLTVRDDVPVTAAQNGQVLYVADYGDLRDTGTDGSVSGSDLDDAGAQNWTTLGIDTDSDVCVISNVTGDTVAGTYEIASVQATEITLGSAPGDGNCSYRIERGPKTYTPSTDVMALMIATAGQVPTGNPLICNYLDRIVLAGAEIAPHVWYMSKKSDPLDWDYADTTSERAVAGTASEAGTPGDPITALIPHSDDYLILACRNSLWRMRGDPAYGGSLDVLSRNIGIIRENAWCLGPSGELVFLSLDGLYVLPPDGNSKPIPLSREVLPIEFHNINPDIMNALLEYDVVENGVHIYLISDASNERYHWWLDWQRKTFWPVALDPDHEPTATCSLQATVVEDSGVILGGRDGELRRFSELAESDCGTAFVNYVLIGPVALNADSFIGRVISMDAVIAIGSGDVTWSVRAADTFEGSIAASSSDSGTWSEGLNATEFPTCVGQAFCLRIDGVSSRRWGLEVITVNVAAAGRRRLA